MQPSDDAWARVVARAPGRSGAWRWWMLAPAAAIVAAVVIAVVIATRSSHEARVHVTGGTGDAVELVPTAPGLESVERARALGTVACLDGSFARGQLSCHRVAGSSTWIVFPSHGSGARITVFTTFGDDSTTADEIRKLGPATATSVRGHSAELVRSQTGVLLTWSERPGVHVTVSSSGTGTGLVRQVAEGLRAEPYPRGLILVAAASDGDVAITARPVRAGWVCIGAKVGSQVSRCAFAAANQEFIRSSSFDTSSEQTLTVLGTVRQSAARVRIVRDDGRHVERAIRRVPGLPGAYFAAKLALRSQVREVDVLDARGRTLAIVPGARLANDESSGTTLDRVGDDAPVVDSGQSAGHLFQLRAAIANATFCVRLDIDGRSAATECSGAADADPIVVGQSGAYLFGATSQGTDVIAGPPGLPGTSVAVVHDAHFPVGFFAASISGMGAGYDLVVLDGAGHQVGGAGASAASSSTASSSSGSSSSGAASSATSSGAP